MAAPPAKKIKPWLQSSNGTAHDRQALPRVLDLVDFAAARVAEIRSLTDTLTGIGGLRRTFQTLPRHLRRRTMSHSLKRYPLRLRQAAQREFERDPNLQAKIDLQELRNRRLKRQVKYAMSTYARRAREHVWLETHLWHTKRMHMDNIWGHRTALAPHDKGERATYRASAHLCTAHDASYLGALEVSGPRDLIIDLFRRVCAPGRSPFGNKLYLDGSREGTCILYRSNCYPLGAIGPISFQWRPAPQTAMQIADALWLWVHPSVWDQTLAELTAVSNAMSASSSSADGSMSDGNAALAGSGQLVFTSLRGQLNRFEIRGSRCQSVLSASLLAALPSSETASASAADHGATGTKIWNAAKFLRTPASLPARAVLGVDILDPHVFSPRQPFSAAIRPATLRPQALPKPSADEQSWLHDRLRQWPAGHVVSASPLWSQHSRDECQSASANRKQKFRKSGAAPHDAAMRDVGAQSAASSSSASIPASSASASSASASSASAVAAVGGARAGRVPVILIQQPGDACRGFGAGYDLIVPAGWGMPMWLALQFGGARAVGLRDRRRSHADQGVPHFPHDFADTLAGQMWDDHRGRVLAAQYAKVPSAKRVPFATFGVNAPFRVDWQSLLSLPPSLDPVSLAPLHPAFWILRDAATLDVFQRPLSHLAAIARLALLDHVSSQTHSQSQSQSQSEHESNMRRCLVRVEVCLVGKGHPTDRAMLCAPAETDIAAALDALARGDVWPGLVQTTAANGASADAGMGASEVPVPARAVIGSAVHGMYSYRRGCGVAAGLIAAPALARLLIDCGRLQCRAPLVLVRNTTSLQYRLACLSVPAAEQ